MVWSTTAKNIGSTIEGNTVRKNDADAGGGALFSGAGSAGTGVPRRRVGQPALWHAAAGRGNDRSVVANAQSLRPAWGSDKRRRLHCRHPGLVPRTHRAESSAPISGTQRRQQTPDARRKRSNGSRARG